MKKLTRLFLLAAIMLAWGSAFTYVNAAQQYCHKSITSGTYTIYLSCETPSTGNYRITIESDVAMTNLTAGCYCNINGVGGGQLIALPGYVRSSDGKKITIDIPSSSAPNLYTPLYILMPGEVNFGAWPTSDINWAGTCVASSDVTKPVMGTATVVGTPGPTSANLKLTATDDVTSPVINYVANDATNSITNKALTTDASGNVTVTGLAASTSYNLTITAKDAAGNVSANSALVSFTTSAHPVAPVPTRDPLTVIGVYTDTYTCPTNTFGWWAATTSVNVVTGGNNSKLITSGNCFGTQFATLQDASSMKYLHVDIYPTTVTTMQIGIVAPAATEAHPAVTLVANQWNSFDVSLASLKTANGAIDLTKLYQVGFWGMNGTFYLDNIYLWTDVAPSLVISTASLTVAQPATSTNTFGITTGSSWTIASDQTWLTPSSTSGTGNATITLTATAANATYLDRTATVTITGSGLTKTIVVTQSPALPAALPAPAYTANKVISVYSDTYTNVMGPNGWEDWWGNTFSSVSLGGNNVLKDVAACCFGASLATPTINVSAMTHLHVDLFPVTATTMTLGFIAITTGTATITPQQVLTLTTGQWNSINLSLSDLKTLFPTADYTQVKQMSISPAVGTFYLDNLLFYNDGTTGISNTISENGISCYPNPVTDMLTINAKSEISQVVVRNLLGQTVKTVSVYGIQKTIDVSAITAGNYFVSIKLANGQTATQKFVKL